MNDEQANSDKSKHDEKDSENQVSQENVTIIEIIDVIADRVDPLLQLIKAFFEQSVAQNKAANKFETRMVIIVTILIVLIIGISGLLTYLNKIDGSTFTFLLGLIVGYVLTFIRDTIRPSGD